MLLEQVEQRFHQPIYQSKSLFSKNVFFCNENSSANPSLHLRSLQFPVRYIRDLVDSHNRILFKT